MKFRAGLVVGKFCPLHRGHQLLIDTAISQCEKVVVISYAKPGFEGYDCARREVWLRSLYPELKCLTIDDDWLAQHISSGGPVPYRGVPHDDESEGIHRLFTAWLCFDVLGETVDAVFTSEEYGDGFASALTGYFAQHGIQAPPVVHVSVDKARAIVPVSGSLIRENPFRYRKFLDDRIYASLVGRIALLGGESTDKSTLAAALAQRLKTSWVPEYGRELWEKKSGALVFGDMLEIGEVQIAREEGAARNADKWLVCDTTPLTTMFYSEALFGRTDPRLTALANRRYDNVFLCAPDIEFHQDGTRQDTAFRDRQHEWYLKMLKERAIAFKLISGQLEERVARCSAILPH